MSSDSPWTWFSGEIIAKTFATVRPITCIFLYFNLPFFLTYIDIVFCFIVRFRFDLDTFLTRAFYYSNHIVLSIRAITFFTLLVKSKGVFIATQPNSTELNWPSWTAYSQVSRVFVYDVMAYKLSQLLFTLWSWVQLSWAELCRYKRALKVSVSWRGVTFGCLIYWLVLVINYFRVATS